MNSMPIAVAHIEGIDSGFVIRRVSYSKKFMERDIYHRRIALVDGVLGLAAICLMPTESVLLERKENLSPKLCAVVGMNDINKDGSVGYLSSSNGGPFPETILVANDETVYHDPTGLLLIGFANLAELSEINTQIARYASDRELLKPFYSSLKK